MSQGFDGNTCAVITAIDEQSPDIAMGVDRSLEIKGQQDSLNQYGAGDQNVRLCLQGNSGLCPCPYRLPINSQNSWLI